MLIEGRGPTGQEIPIAVDASGGLELSLREDRTLTSEGNSTTAPLGADGEFIGEGELNEFGRVLVSCKTDQEGTLFFEFSNDGTNWDSTFPPQGFKIAASVHLFHKLSPE